MFRSVLCAALMGLLPACGGDESKSSDGNDNGGGAGNEPPRVCQTDENCDTGNACRIGVCNPATRSCSYTNFDGDADGHPPLVCGGDDCDDANPAAHPGAREIAGNSRDDNCNGRVDEAAGNGVEVDDPACRGNESCNVLFCGSWSWRYTDVAYEEGMGDARWLPQLRQLMLQDGQRTIRQDGCVLDITPVTLREGSSSDFLDAKVKPAPLGFSYGEGLWWSNEQTTVFCTGALNEAHAEISGNCGGDHGIMPGSAVPYHARVTITKQ